MKREENNALYLANKIAMHRGRIPGAVLVVEGIDDRLLYGKFYPNTAFYVAHGKPSVKAVMRVLTQRDIPGVIGILDADFEHLDGVPCAPGCLRTDTHDLETMIMRSPALEHVIREYLPQEDEEDDAKPQEDVQERVAKAIGCLLYLGSQLGFYRWASATQKLSLVFDNLPYSDFILEKTWSWHQDGLHRALTRRPSRLQEALERLPELRSCAPDPYQLCCGHDLVEILSIGLQRVIAQRRPAEVKPEILERDLRLAFGTPFFQKTDLYTSLQSWGSRQARYPLA